MNLKQKLKSILYGLMNITTLGDFNRCEKCEYRQRNFTNFSYAPDKFVAYDLMLNEWIVFSNNNTYVKLWLMNKTIINFHILTEDLWRRIRYLCSKCIKAEVLKNERHTKLT